MLNISSAASTASPAAYRTRYDDAAVPIAVRHFFSGQIVVREASCCSQNCTLFLSVLETKENDRKGWVWGWVLRAPPSLFDNGSTRDSGGGFGGSQESRNIVGIVTNDLAVWLVHCVAISYK